MCYFLQRDQFTLLHWNITKCCLRAILNSLKGINFLLMGNRDGWSLTIALYACFQCNFLVLLNNFILYIFVSFLDKIIGNLILIRDSIMLNYHFNFVLLMSWCGSRNSLTCPIWRVAVLNTNNIVWLTALGRLN